jgi:pyrroloquinoline quinone (PQQ) biosynthesis protein C
MLRSTAIDDVQTALQLTQQRLINRLSTHPFLVSCREGRASLEALKRLLVQQGLYSSHFTRYLCALMANLSSNDQVLELAENLFEELGLAPDSPTPHYILYRDMLNAFDLRLDDAEPTSGTRQLINAMYAHCRSGDPAVGLGALCIGAEGLVPSLYADYVKGFEAHGINRDTIQFFYLHIACDDEHALTLSRMMAEQVAKEPQSMERILLASETLVNARLGFLDDVASASVTEEMVATAAV